MDVNIVCRSDPGSRSVAFAVIGSSHLPFEYSIYFVRSYLLSHPSLYTSNLLGVSSTLVFIPGIHQRSFHQVNLQIFNRTTSETRQRNQPHRRHTGRLTQPFDAAGHDEMCASKRPSDFEPRLCLCQCVHFPVCRRRFLSPVY